MADWDHTTDFVMIGSGAGGLCAALVARDGGAEALVLEKGAMLGGNSAYSGGTMWVPDNVLMQEAGLTDSIQDGLTYLTGCIGDAGPATSTARRLAYLSEGQRLIRWLRAKGIRLNRVPGYADYYGELPGASRDGRAVQCDAFDLAALGEWEARIPKLAPVIAYVEEFPQITLMKRTLKGFLTFCRVALRTSWAKLRGRVVVANGAALVSRLLHAGLAQGVTVWPETPVADFIVEGGKVVGVSALREGREIRIRARRGVVIASGGFARNLEMRERYGRKPASTEWTFSNPGETGEIVQRTIALGAATALMDEAIWIPTAISPLGPIYLEYERGKPHALLVDGTAQRYTDEGIPYMMFGSVMQARHSVAPAIPSWLIFDSQHRNKYVFAGNLPGRTPESWLTSGFLKRAGSLDELASACGLDATTLKATISRFNGFAATGKDADFHRGETSFSRSGGDPTHGPNPCLGPVNRPPFYALQVFPGDLGSFGGILTDADSRVLRPDGSAIGGLYATGNATAPVFGREYPCTGGSIASTMIFGSLAIKHALAQPSAG